VHCPQPAGVVRFTSLRSPGLKEIPIQSGGGNHEEKSLCIQETVVSADGKDAVNKGVCDIVDRQGDVWWLWYDATREGSTWGILGGTGKYSGMTGGGMTRTELLAPDG